MASLLRFILGFGLIHSVAHATEQLSPEEAAQRVAAGTAVLIDVREPAEWRDGVAEPALLLPMSDLRGSRDQWTPALTQHRDKQLILYCRSGNRSGIAASLLEKEGFKVANSGAYVAWRDAKLPVRTPAPSAD